MESAKKAAFKSDRSLPGYRSTVQQFFSVRSHEPVWRALRSSVVRGDGVIVVTGEAGIGKSQLLLQLQGVLPENRDIALVFDASQPLAAFTHTLCAATGIDIAGPTEWSITTKELLGAIASRVKNGRKFLVAVDQAHQISEENLAILSRLVLFSMDHARPVQIILVGRLDLIEYLELPAFQILRKAVIASVRMTPLTRVEVWEYIRFQTQRILGKKIRMTWPAWLEIFTASRGNPGEIDVLLQKILFLVQERNVRILTGNLVRQCRMEQDPNYHPPPGRRVMPWVSLALLVLVFGYIIGSLVSWSSSPQQVDEIAPSEQLNESSPAAIDNDENSIGPIIAPKTNKKDQKPLPLLTPQKTLSLLKTPQEATIPQKGIHPQEETPPLEASSPQKEIPTQEDIPPLEASSPQKEIPAQEDLPPLEASTPAEAITPQTQKLHPVAPDVQKVKKPSLPKENLDKTSTTTMPEILPVRKSTKKWGLPTTQPDNTSTESTTQTAMRPVPVPIPLKKKQYQKRL